MQLAVFCCVVVFTSLYAYTNCLIPLRPRPLLERFQPPSEATTTERITPKPVLALRRRDNNDATRKKDKNDDCADKNKPCKPTKEGKIVNTGEIEKQIIVNIENHLMPQFKINLGSGMLKNLICGNFSFTCEPEFTTPDCERPPKKPTRRPKPTPPSEEEGTSEPTEIISASDAWDETTEHRTKPKKSTTAVVEISLPHASVHSDESSESTTDSHHDVATEISEEISIITITEEEETTLSTRGRKKHTTHSVTEIVSGTDFPFDDETTKCRTRRPTGRTTPLKTRRTTTKRPPRTTRKRKTQKPPASEATVIISLPPERETTKCRWPKGTTQRRRRTTTTEIIDISVPDLDDGTEETTPRTRRPTKRTKPPEVVTVEISGSIPGSDESTTEMSDSSESPESTESNESLKSIETCESTEPPESTESNESVPEPTESSSSETEPEEPSYDSSNESEESDEPKRTTSKPKKKIKIITKLNCTDLFPPNRNRNKRIRKRDLFLTEMHRLRCSDEICKQCENCEGNLKKADNMKSQGEKLKFSAKEEKDGNEEKRSKILVPFTKGKASEKVGVSNEKLKFPSNEDISRKLERLQRSVHHVNLTASVPPS